MTWIVIGMTIIAAIGAFFGGFKWNSRKKLVELGKARAERDQYKVSYENEKRKNKRNNDPSPTLDELLVWSDRMSDDSPDS